MTIGEANEEVLHLPSSKAERLREFISRIVVEREPIYYNCISFASYTAGNLALDAARRGMEVIVSANSPQEVNPGRLMPGERVASLLSQGRDAQGAGHFEDLFRRYGPDEC